jgi:transcription antitermination factor NusG
MGTKGNDIAAVTNHLDDHQPRWFAVYTKYKAEKLVVDHLTAKRIEAYVPLLTTTKRYTRKVKTYSKPLLNCYIFVKIAAPEYTRVLETQYVLGFVKVRKHLVSIPDDEIQLLRRIVGEVEQVQSGPMSMQAGQEVEIVAGNLTGIRGVLLTQKSKQVFVVRLDYIGVQLEMEVDKKLLSPVGHRLPV